MSFAYLFALVLSWKHVSSFLSGGGQGLNSGSVAEAVAQLHP
jgi:hypothetical protein